MIVFTACLLPLTLVLALGPPGRADAHGKSVYWGGWALVLPWGLLLAGWSTATVIWRRVEHDRFRLLRLKR